VPFRLDEFRAKIAFTTSAEMPYLIYQACRATGTVSGTVYCQHAVAEALARDLGVPVADILANLPAPRGPAKHLYAPARRVDQDPSGGRAMIGPANTVEEVR